MAFDARAAKVLQAGEHMIVDDAPGLRLVATATRRTWTYRFKSPVDGRMRQISLGRWPAMSPSSAFAAWEEARARRDAGEDPAKTKRSDRAAERAAAVAPKPVGYTVRKLVDHYLDEHIKHRRQEKGQIETRRLFDKYLGEVADLQASAVTRSVAYALLSGMADKPVVASMLRAELGAAWDLALDAGRIPQEVPNWWRLVMRGRLQSKGKMVAGQRVGTAKRVLTLDEMRDLMVWMPNFSRNVADVLTLYMLTGTRGAEIVQMHASEIAEEADGLWWTCPKAKTKNARHANAGDLRVPLVGRAEEIVRRRVELYPSGFLFPTVGTTKCPHMQQKAIQTAVWVHQPYATTRPEDLRPRLEVTHWAPHDLRRSVRTQLAAMGCPAEVAESVLGHMLPGVQGVYNRHQYDAERRQWLTLLERRLRERA